MFPEDARYFGPTPSLWPLDGAWGGRNARNALAQPMGHASSPPRLVARRSDDSGRRRAIRADTRQVSCGNPRTLDRFQSHPLNPLPADNDTLSQNTSKKGAIASCISPPQFVLIICSCLSIYCANALEGGDYPWQRQTTRRARAPRFVSRPAPRRAPARPRSQRSRRNGRRRSSFGYHATR